MSMAAGSGASGFTLVELLVVIAITSVLLGLAMPQFGEMLAARRVQNVAVSLASAYKTAQVEAIRRNRTVEVAFTNSTPLAANTVSAIPVTATAARHWISRTTNPASADDFVGGQSLTGDLANVSLTHGNLSSIGFTPTGRPLDLSGATPAALAGPLVIPVSATGSTRRLCVAVNTGGSVRVCDPSRAPGTATACQPALPAGVC